MGFWVTILQIMPWACLWNTVSQHLGYVKDLSKNLDCLMSETNALKRKRDEFQVDVEAAESIGKKKLRCVDDWFNDVNKIVPEVDSIKLEFNQGTINPLSRHKFGKRVLEKIMDVKNLQDKGVFEEVAESPRQQPAREVPGQLQRQNTPQEMLEKITQALSDEEVSTVCIYGMGGIGKTTLMKTIYNKFIQNGQFDQVIWVTVSKDLNMQLIQQKIGNKLEVEFHGNEDLEGKRDRLYACLSNVRYMLILDDLWEAFSLDQVGIPQPNKQNRCKVAITTRLIEVSSMMKTDCEIKVKALSSQEAWDLFCSNMGDVVLQPEIQTLAKEVVKECGGLPLAINTVGGAMRRKCKKELWQDALRALRASAVPDIQGMRREVFLPLKLSYDYLEDPKIQLCFLHCSLYPEDYDICVEDLVRLWAFEEGLIDNVDSLDEALNKGHYILERLKDASLLDEAEEGHLCPHVRMHDLLRDLAIWITSPSSSSSYFQASKFLVKAGEGLKQPPEESMWEGMGRISLMYNEIKDLQITPKSPDLISLFLCYNRQLYSIHTDFFQLMPKLQILDLRSTLIKSLPPSLSQLVNLHAIILTHCSSLVEMPPLGNLKELRLLDLQATGIEKLPEGISNLVKLKQLNLSLTNALTMIPSNLISKLTHLEDLRLWRKAQMHVAAWREVATLTRLSYLTISLSKLDNFSIHDLQLLSNLKQFHVCFGGNGSFNLKQTEKDLQIVGCCNFPKGIEGLINHVKSLKLSSCEAPEHLSQIVGYSKSLTVIEVASSNGVKCIIDWREMEDIAALDSLQILYLCHLDFLEMVFDGGSHLPDTHFQQLQRVDIRSCPKLRCVFSSDMVNHLYQLTWLRVKDCEEVEEIVQGDTLPDCKPSLLRRLSFLSLIHLPRLTSICKHRLTLTSLECINAEGCPELKKLPTLCSSIQKIEGRVKGSREWWGGIEWEDDNSRHLYSTIYTKI